MGPKIIEEQQEMAQKMQKELQDFTIKTNLIPITYFSTHKEERSYATWCKCVAATQLTVKELIKFKVMAQLANQVYYMIKSNGTKHCRKWWIPDFGQCKYISMTSMYFWNRRKPIQSGLTQGLQWVKHQPSHVKYHPASNKCTCLLANYLPNASNMEKHIP